MQEAITKAVRKFLAVVKELHEAYPKKRFTLDGRQRNGRTHDPASTCLRRGGNAR